MHSSFWGWLLNNINVFLTIVACLRVNALLPIDVPNAFATSFAPAFNITTQILLLGWRMAWHGMVFIKSKFPQDLSHEMR